MSRIDEALRRASGSAAVSPELTPDPGEAARAALEGYVREAGVPDRTGFPREAREERREAPREERRDVLREERRDVLREEREIHATRPAPTVVPPPAPAAPVESAVWRFSDA